jgi:hypothetical protein
MDFSFVGKGNQSDSSLVAAAVTGHPRRRSSCAGEGPPPLCQPQALPCALHCTSRLGGVLPSLLLRCVIRLLRAACRCVGKPEDQRRDDRCALATAARVPHHPWSPRSCSVGGEKGADALIGGRRQSRAWSRPLWRCHGGGRETIRMHGHRRVKSTTQRKERHDAAGRDRKQWEVAMDVAAHTFSSKKLRGCAGAAAVMNSITQSRVRTCCTAGSMQAAAPACRGENP